VMSPQPDQDATLGDGQTQMQFVQRVAADIADGKLQSDSPEAEQMRLVIQNLGQSKEVVMREGLIFGWPKSTAIIPDENTVALRDFLGSNWVAEEFCLTPDEVKTTYGVDVGDKFTSYDKNDTGKDYTRPAVRNNDM